MTKRIQTQVHKEWVKVYTKISVLVWQMPAKVYTDI